MKGAKFNGAKFTHKSAPRVFGTTAPKCPTCDKSVYAAEQVLGPIGKPYHNLCLKCISCLKRLDSSTLLEHDSEPYCKPCHSRNFGPKGVGFGNAVSGEYEVRTPPGSPARGRMPGGANGAGSPVTPGAWTPRRVGAAESPTRFGSVGKKVGEDEVKGLGLGRLAQLAINDDAPLRPDPRLARSESGATTDDDDDFEPPPLPNPIFNVTARPNSRSLPPPPPLPTRPHSPSPTTTSTSSSSPRPFSPPLPQPGSPAGRPSSPLKHASFSPTSKGPVFDPVARGRGLSTGPVKCPRCDGTVYFAEQVLAVGKGWHSAFSFSSTGDTRHFEVSTKLNLDHRAVLTMCRM